MRCSEGEERLLQKFFFPLFLPFGQKIHPHHTKTFGMVGVYVWLKGNELYKEHRRACGSGHHGELTAAQAQHYGYGKGGEC